MLQLKDDNSSTRAIESATMTATPVYCDFSTTIEACNLYTYKIYYPDDLMKHKLPGSFVYLDENKDLKEVYIKEVRYHNPATIVFWSDGSKTVSKTHSGDIYSPEAGLVLCILKKTQGKTLKGLLDAWVPGEAFTVNKKPIIQTLRQVRKLFTKNK